MYLVVTHSAYNSSGETTYGPANHVYDFITNENLPSALISHSLFGGWPGFIKIKNKKRSLGKLHHLNLLFRSIEHIILNFVEAIRLRKKNDLIYIGADPINSLSGAWLKIFGKLDKNIYFIVDYADDRFPNKILNNIYHSLDKFCMRYADEIWCVSTRIIDKKIKLGVPKDKLRLLPNSPNIKSFPKFKQKRNLEMVIVSHLSKSLNLEPILKAIKLIAKKNPTLKLNIIGTGPEEDRFRYVVKKLKIEKKINFLGQLDHKEVIEVVSKSFLGFAIYTDANSWNYYGDSMKAREYIAGGTPVVINNIPSTADDDKKYRAGKVLKKVSSREIAAFVSKCISNKKYYNELQGNALDMAKIFDKYTILKTLLILPVK